MIFVGSGPPKATQWANGSNATSVLKRRVGWYILAYGLDVGFERFNAYNNARSATKTTGLSSAPSTKVYSGTRDIVIPPLGLRTHAKVPRDSNKHAASRRCAPAPLQTTPSCHADPITIVVAAIIMEPSRPFEKQYLVFVSRRRGVVQSTPWHALALTAWRGSAPKACMIAEM